VLPLRQRRRRQRRRLRPFKACQTPQVFGKLRQNLIRLGEGNVHFVCVLSAMQCSITPVGDRQFHFVCVLSALQCEMTVVIVRQPGWPTQTTPVF